MPIISIIVPVFNVDLYLKKCLDSIINQTFSDFEVILIDDGSTDTSGAICDEYALKDLRFRVIHQNNKGVSAARNAGLEISRGEYLGFVDADDWIEPEMYETMINKIMDNNLDIVICGTEYFGDSDRAGQTDSMKERYYSREELLEELFNSPNEIGGGNCNKLMKNKNLSFDERYSIGEDIIFLFNNIMLSKNGFQIKKALYHVRERKDSASRENALKTEKSLLVIYDKLIKLTENCSDSIRTKAVTKYLDSWIRYMRYIDKNQMLKTKSMIMNRVIKLLINRRINRKQLHSIFHELLFA